MFTNLQFFSEIFTTLENSVSIFGYFSPLYVCRVLPTSLGPRFLILHRSSANPPLATVMLRRPVSKKVGRTCLLQLQARTAKKQFNYRSTVQTCKKMTRLYCTWILYKKKKQLYQAMVCPKFTYLLFQTLTLPVFEKTQSSTAVSSQFSMIYKKNKLDSINHLNLSFKPMQVKEEFLE